MHNPAALPRPGRALAVLAALVVALGAAFVLAPLTLAAIRPGGGFADQRAIIDALRGAFVQYWESGSRVFPGSLENVVDYWSGYHVAKALIAALLLVVLVALGVRLWKALLRGGGHRAVLLPAWVLVVMLALSSVVLVTVNVRGAIVPFSSLVSMLPLGRSNGQLTDVVDQVRQELAGSVGGHNPALAVLVGDFARYHAVLAVLAVIVALVLTGVSVLSWRRFVRAGSADRRVLGSSGVLFALAALVVIVVAAANAGTAADPAPALLAFFNGGS
ncbi:MAG TPA: hypothetical protein VJX10_15205 [Pseudonocardiaceae bacterium]|nr:hypothetical protein [Pseudonocardiaceae bacterium]